MLAASPPRVETPERWRSPMAARPRRQVIIRTACSPRASAAVVVAAPSPTSITSRRTPWGASCHPQFMRKSLSAVRGWSTKRGLAAPRMSCCPATSARVAFNPTVSLPRASLAAVAQAPMQRSTPVEAINWVASSSERSCRAVIRSSPRRAYNSVCPRRSRPPARRGTGSSRNRSAPAAASSGSVPAPTAATAEHGQ